MKMNANGVTIGLILFACMTFTQGALAADIYKLDKSHTRVGFMVRHLVISKVRGEFKQYEATILFDANNVSKSSMEGTIQVASIDTDNEKRDKHLRSPDFFNAADYPTITFKSKRIDKQGDQYVMIGDFTIHGVTKEIEMPFAVTALITHRNKTRFGFSAELEINRQDYNVAYSKLTDSGGLVVSNKVVIEIDGEAIKQ
jgi:polyisoprenoid-binding protein YceI